MKKIELVFIFDLENLDLLYDYFILSQLCRILDISDLKYIKNIKEDFTREIYLLVKTNILGHEKNAKIRKVFNKEVNPTKMAYVISFYEYSFLNLNNYRKILDNLFKKLKADKAYINLNEDKIF